MNQLSSLKQTIVAHVLAMREEIGSFKASRMDELTAMFEKGEVPQDKISSFLRQSVEDLSDVEKAFVHFEEGVKCLKLNGNGSDLGHEPSLLPADLQAFGMKNPDPDTHFERVTPDTPIASIPPKPPREEELKELVEQECLNFLRDKAEDGWASSMVIRLSVQDTLKRDHKIKLPSKGPHVKYALSRLRTRLETKNDGKYWSLEGNPNPSPREKKEAAAADEDET